MNPKVLAYHDGHASPSWRTLVEALSLDVSLIINFFCVSTDMEVSHA